MGARDPFGLVARFPSSVIIWRERERKKRRSYFILAWYIYLVLYASLSRKLSRPFLFNTFFFRPWLLNFIAMHQLLLWLDIVTAVNTTWPRLNIALQTHLKGKLTICRHWWCPCYSYPSYLTTAVLNDTLLLFNRYNNRNWCNRSRYVCLIQI